MQMQYTTCIVLCCIHQKEGRFQLFSFLLVNIGVDVSAPLLANQGNLRFLRDSQETRGVTSSRHHTGP